MEWKCYRVQACLTLPCPEEECVVEAPSPGMALEHYLAGHGMLRYDHAFVEETDQDPSPGYEQGDLLALYGATTVDLERACAACDLHHNWQSFA